jgi:hypothetical protein
MIFQMNLYFSKALYFSIKWVDIMDNEIALPVILGLLQVLATLWGLAVIIYIFFMKYLKEQYKRYDLKLEYDIFPIFKAFNFFVFVSIFWCIIGVFDITFFNGLNDLTMFILITFSLISIFILANFTRTLLKETVLNPKKFKKII